MILVQGARITPLLRPWLTMTMTESRLSTEGRKEMRSMNKFWKGWEALNLREVMARSSGHKWINSVYSMWTTLIPPLAMIQRIHTWLKRCVCHPLSWILLIWDLWSESLVILITLTSMRVQWGLDIGTGIRVCRNPRKVSSSCLTSLVNLASCPQSFHKYHGIQSTSNRTKLVWWQLFGVVMWWWRMKMFLSYNFDIIS